jgi:hypothetical protein
MSNVARICAYFIGFAATAACQAFSPSDRGAPALSIVTDQSAYTAELLGGEGTKRAYAFTVVARLENLGSAPAYLSVCSNGARSVPLHSTELIRQDTSLTSGYSVVWACAGSPLLRIDPGESRVDTLRFVGPSRRDGRTGEPYPGQAVQGVFRVYYVASSCSREAVCELPFSETVSNQFRVQLAQ